MCGISGAFGMHGHLPDDVRAAVPKMNARIAHRGPDGEGFFQDAAVALGHRRLAIIDRAGGHQPIANEDESCWIVFNGEIYNHRALRARLEARGHRYRTASDTETILHTYEEYGAGCVDELHGMFAFVIYDARRHELFAARDRVGKKPFFYFIRDGIFHFASELTALAVSPLWRGDVDPDGIEACLSLGYCPGDRTIYRDVFKLPPAHTLTVSRTGARTNGYWDVTEFDTAEGPDDVLLAEIETRLRAAVADRLETEVPLGAFLSGGIDSGLVVSFMAEAMGTRVLTTTVGFEGGDDETGAALAVARHLGTEHHAEMLDAGPAAIDAAVHALSEPLADSSVVPTWLVSQAARRRVTVALSGDGGDETFAGYDFRYVPHAMEARARRVMPAALSALAGRIGRAWPRDPRIPRVLRAGSILENLGEEDATAYYADLTFLKPAETRRLLGRNPERPFSGRTYEFVTEIYRACGSRDAAQRAQYADFKIYLPNGPLAKVDRMSMAHGLEIRSPLLDHRLVEFAFRIPAHRKQRPSRGKVLLRQLAARRLPRDLSTLPKRGFSAPAAAWFRGPLAERFTDDVLGRRSLLGAHVDLADLRRRFDEHARSVADHGHALWASWILASWLGRQAAARGVAA